MFNRVNGSVLRACSEECDAGRVEVLVDAADQPFVARWPRCMPAPRTGAQHGWWPRAAIIVAGVTMMILGVVVVARWPETRFAPVDAGRRWTESTAIFRRGIAVARADRVILLVLAANLLLHGSDAGFGRLFERRLVLLGMPTEPDPIVWFAAVALVGAAIGATTLRFVEASIEGANVAKRVYVVRRLACLRRSRRQPYPRVTESAVPRGTEVVHAHACAPEYAQSSVSLAIPQVPVEDTAIVV